MCAIQFKLLSTQCRSKQNPRCLCALLRVLLGFSVTWPRDNFCGFDSELGASSLLSSKLRRITRYLCARQTFALLVPTLKWKRKFPVLLIERQIIFYIRFTTLSYLNGMPSNLCIVTWMQRTRNKLKPDVHHTLILRFYSTFFKIFNTFFDVFWHISHTLFGLF